MKDSLQQALIRIDHLQHQVDSLKNAQTLDQVKYRATEHQEVVNQVKEFYNDSFVNLLWLLGTLIVIIGILQPIINGWFQRKNLKELSTDISSGLQNVFQEKLNALEVSNIAQLVALKSELKLQRDELKEEQKELRIRTDADGYIHQGLRFLDKKEYKDYARFMLTAFILLKDLPPEQKTKSVLMNFISGIKELSADYLQVNKESLVHPSFQPESFDTLIKSILDDLEPIYSDAILNLKQTLRTKNILPDGID